MINTYTLSKKKKNHAEDVIKAILLNDSYHINNVLSYRKSKPFMNMTAPNNCKKHITFTYHGPAV
jgi:hypothetical protein